MSNPLVSVIIPTFNSEKFLEVCLSSVKSQSYSNIEIIVVDNYSSDHTREIANKNNVKVILCEANRSKARNVGMALAEGAFILSMDSDMELTSKVIEECLALISSDDKIGGIIIPERSFGNSFWVSVRNFERSFYEGTEIESARFFKKTLIDQVCGYDEAVTFFEDSTLPQKLEKLGYTMNFRINAELVHHEPNFSLSKWFTKKFRYGKSASKYKRKYVFASKQMNVLYRFSIFLKNERFYSKPLLGFGVLTLKMLEFVSSGLGLLVGESKD